MRMYDILQKKRYGEELTREEIEFFKANGIPHLALQTVSGMEIVTDDGDGKNNNHADDGEEGK